MKKLILVGALSGLLGANLDKMPDVSTMVKSSVIHEGTITKVEGTTYIFSDGASFVIKDGELSGMIPMNAKVVLKQGAFGSYYFEIIK